jgi:carbon storage regulator
LTHDRTIATSRSKEHPMLVLSRKPTEKVVITGGITVTVTRIEANQVRLGFEAPGDVEVLRAELLDGEEGKTERRRDEGHGRHAARGKDPAASAAARRPRPAAPR